MNRTACVLAASLAFSASFAIAQTSQPVAYIYVSSNYSGANNRVTGYAASADGKLTQIAGSPWADNLSWLANNGTYLYGSTNIASDNGRNVFSYRIASNGALRYLGATNIQKTGTDNSCNRAASLTFDHTGSFLYVLAQEADCNPYGAYQSFAVDKTTGKLGYLGETGYVGYYALPLTVLADNDFAYADNGEEADQMIGYRKESNGNLVTLTGGVAFPRGGQPSGTNGDFSYAAADTTNHLAEAFVYTDTYNGAYLVTKIATVAINTANGAQSTSSTYDNMPATDTQVSALAMAPSGKLLAVGGSSGIQIFNFNPSGQATRNTGLITSANITALFWDNDNHLYAISNADNALHVFTVTANSAEEAPGSPYAIPHPVGLTGHPL